MRLIDADEAIREYEACIENYILSGNDSKNRYIEDWEYVIKQLSNKPTAYDVEAVVRELEELKYIPPKDWAERNYNAGINDAISAIRKGQAE